MGRKKQKLLHAFVLVACLMHVTHGESSITETPRHSSHSKASAKPSRLHGGRATSVEQVTSSLGYKTTLLMSGMFSNGANSSRIVTPFGTSEPTSDVLASVTKGGQSLHTRPRALNEGDGSKAKGQHVESNRSPLIDVFRSTTPSTVSKIDVSSVTDSVEDGSSRLNAAIDVTMSDDREPSAAETAVLNDNVTIPSSSSSSSSSTAFPRNSEATPNSGTAIPNNHRTIPESDVLLLEDGMSALNHDTAIPKNGTVIPNNDLLVLRNVISVSNNNSVAPQRDVDASDNNTVITSNGMVIPSDGMSVPESDTVLGNGNMTSRPTPPNYTTFPRYDTALTADSLSVPDYDITIPTKSTDTPDDEKTISSNLTTPDDVSYQPSTPQLGYNDLDPWPVLENEDTGHGRFAEASTNQPDVPPPPVISVTDWETSANNIMLNFLSECRKEQVCDGTEWASLLHFDAVCRDCNKCSCVDDSCYLDEDCCLDKILDDTGRLRVRSPGCQSVFLSASLNEMHVLMTDTCAEDWEEEEGEGEVNGTWKACVDASRERVSEWWPVWSSETGVTYRNLHCARCNREEVGGHPGGHRLQPWDVVIMCNSSSHPRNTRTLLDVVDEAVATPGCQLSFQSPPGARSESCSPYIIPKSHTCAANASIQDWRVKSYAVFTSMCNAFFGEGPPEDTRSTWQNLICALCDFRRSDQLCERLAIDTPFPFVLVISSKALKNVASSAKGQCGHCAEDEVYDMYESRCRKLECSETRRLENGRCQMIAGQSLGLGFQLSFRLTPTDDLQSVVVGGLLDLTRAAVNIYHAFDSHESVHKSFQYDSVLVVAHTTQGADRTEAPTGPFQIISVKEFDVQLKIVSQNLLDTQDMENDLLNLINSVWKVSVGGNLTSFQSAALYFPQHNGSWQLVDSGTPDVRVMLSVRQYIDYMIEVGGTFLRDPFDNFPEPTRVHYYHPVQATLNCAKTAFLLSKGVTWEAYETEQPLQQSRSNRETSSKSNDSSGARRVLQSVSTETGEVTVTVDLESGHVYHHPSGKTISHQYAQLVQHDRLLVCAEQLFAANDGRPSLSPLVLERFFSTQIIYVSVVCQSLSVVCLFLVLFTYCLFAELRSLPGRNTMGLVTSLLMAMLVFERVLVLFGFELGVARVEVPIVCTLLGVLIHFCLLSSFTWMVICSTSMYRIFSDVLRSRPDHHASERRAFLHHVLLSLLVPALIVVLTLLGNWLARDQDCQVDLGYGRGVCYLSNVWSLVLASVVPICLAVTVNLALFLATLWSMRSLSVQVKVATQQHRQQLAIYARMASLTGINWLVGMVTAVVDSMVLWYVFIVLCGLQGLYVFIAFVCNARVISLYRALLRRIQHAWERDPQDSSRTETTTP